MKCSIKGCDKDCGTSWRMYENKPVCYKCWEDLVDVHMSKAFNETFKEVLDDERKNRA